MTQADAKDAVDKAFAAQIERLFGIFVSNLETEDANKTTAAFERGFDFSLRAHAIAIGIAGKVQP